MRILLFGATGACGRSFLDVASARHEVEAVPHAAAPLEDADAVARAVRRARPDWIVNMAAMSKPDPCEADPEAAMRVNALGAENVARAAAEAGARVAHVSTDYVFDGARGGYREEDPTGPVNAYARSKAEGERRVLAAAPDAVVARTAQVFGRHGASFPRDVVRALRAGREVRALADQRGNPTLAEDLAEMILALAAADAEGIFHTAGATPTSRHAFATHVADALGLDASLVRPVTMDEIGWRAPRPRDTTLDVTKVSRHKRPLGYREALAAHADALLG